MKQSEILKKQNQLLNEIDILSSKNNKNKTK